MSIKTHHPTRDKQTSESKVANSLNPISQHSNYPDTPLKLSNHPLSLTVGDIEHLQRTLGNRAVGRLLPAISTLSQRVNTTSSNLVQLSPEEDIRAELQLRFNSNDRSAISARRERLSQLFRSLEREDAQRIYRLLTASTRGSDSLSSLFRQSLASGVREELLAILRNKFSQESANEQEPLRLVSRDDTWLVFNRPAFRGEVVQYIWGNRFRPNQTELYARSGEVTTRDGNELDIGDTHWMLAQTLFAARPDMYRQMDPAVRSKLDRLPDISVGRPPQAPEWVPQEIWDRFLKASDGVYRYSACSPVGTDIILIKRDRIPWGGYAEAPIDEAVLFQQMGVAPPSLVRRLLGAERPEQAGIRWLAQANRGYNRFMWQQIQSGVGPQQAQKNYRDAVYQAYIRAFIPLIGGSFAAHPAGGTLGDVLRGTGVIR